MGGFFAVASRGDCVNDLFFGTDYHSHLGTKRGGMAVLNKTGFVRFIHDISNTQFRSKFEQDLLKMQGNMGVGVISDFEDQPLLVGSHLGAYAIVTVGVVTNLADLVADAFNRRSVHFSEMSGGVINPTELVATLINEGATFEEGIRNAQEKIQGSCSLLLLTEKGVFAARDKYGRTSVALGVKNGAYAATMETTSFPTLDYEFDRFLGPGEVVRMTPDGVEVLAAPRNKLRICSFLWVYYGYPSSAYEGINVEQARYRCGAALARAEMAGPQTADLVAGIPDSGTGHAMGYAIESGIPFERPFVKYTPTWPRSFMPQDQSIRDLVAQMKLVPIKELMQNKRLIFCEDSIVRGTQLKDILQRVYDHGAREIHMRPACPPLVYGCKFLNFSRSRSVMDLAARRAIVELEGKDPENLKPYTCAGSDKYCAMVEKIRQRLKLTSLKYQTLEDLVAAIGLPKEQLCTYCWDGEG
jgi:amidophosphoribosyltransferase